MRFQVTALSLPRRVLADLRSRTRLAVLHALGELYRIQQASLARLWHEVQNGSRSSSGNILWYYAGSNLLDELPRSSIDPDSEPTMATRRSLNRWHASLLTAKRPINTTCDGGRIIPSKALSLGIQPIRFASRTRRRSPTLTAAPRERWRAAA
jgi:hypothetical protein